MPSRAPPISPPPKAVLSSPVKMHTASATAKADRAKKSARTSSSSAGAPVGWMQGEGLQSRVTKARMLDLEAEGLMCEGSWRLLGPDEEEPSPKGDERVLLVPHLERGFSLPPHPLFQRFLNFFGAQLHHLPPNAIVYLAAYISLCENFLGCHPHWGLFKHLFTCRMMTVKKPTRSEDKTNVAQLCGGLGIQLRGKGCFPKMTFPYSVKGWQENWFYCHDIPVGEGQSGLPPYTSDCIGLVPRLTVTKEEKTEVDILVIALVALVQKGVNGLDLLEVFFQRRIQPLQARGHPMWEYSGPDDSTRTHPEELKDKEVEAKIKAITPARDNPRGSPLVVPLSVLNPTNKAFTQMSSLVPLVVRGPVDVASDTDHPEDTAEAREDEESGEGEDDEEDDEEGSEDDDEVESSCSKDRVPETRSKAHHDSGIHGGGPKGSRTSKPSGPALATRAAKRGREELASPPEKTTKQPKIAATKPRKVVLIPKIKMAIPVASAADTSTASPDPQTQEKELADADVASSKAPREVINLDATDKIDPKSTPANADAMTQEPSLADTLVPTQEVSSGAGAALGTGSSSQLSTSSMPNIFALHHVLEDQVGASKEALVQLEIMSDRLKTTYDASEALKKNVRSVCELGSHYKTLENDVLDLRISLDAEKTKNSRLEEEKKTLEETMKTALEKKDTELAVAQKEASRKAKEAEEKLKSVEKLEEEKKALEATIQKSNQELAELKKLQTEWQTELNHITAKKAELEEYVEEFSGEANEKLKAFCDDVAEETDKIEKELDPTQGLLKDSAAMSVL